MWYPIPFMRIRMLLLGLFFLAGSIALGTGPASIRRNPCSLDLVYAHHVQSNLIPSLRLSIERSAAIPLNASSVNFLLGTIIETFLSRSEYPELNFSDIERALRDSELEVYLVAIPRRRLPAQYRVEYPNPLRSHRARPPRYGIAIVVAPREIAHGFLQELGITAEENLNRLAYAGWQRPIDETAN